MVHPMAGDAGDISQAELFELRVIVHGWASVDEVTILGAPEIARKVLRVLDALAALTGTQTQAEQWDTELRKLADPAIDFDRHERERHHG